MGLFIGDRLQTVASEKFSSLLSFLSVYGHFYEESCACLKSSDVFKISKKDSVFYVNQREYAVLSGNEKCKISKFGTDMATTCHMVVLSCMKHKVAALGHFDGSSTQQGVNGMLCDVLEEVSNIDGAASVIDLYLHIIGGFDDSKKYSEKLSVELLQEFNQRSESKEFRHVKIHLQTFCATSLNNVKMEMRSVDGQQPKVIDSPVIFGIIFDVKNGNLHPAVFDDDAKLPVPDLRSSRSLNGVRDMPNVFSIKDNAFVLKPFSYRSFANVELWILQPNHIIRRYMSTSPDVEPENFEEHIRSTLRFIKDNPNPMQSVFKNSQNPLKLLVKVTENGIEWISG